MSKIINYEELEKPIRDIELVLENYDVEEKQLILKQVSGRMVANMRKTMINDTIMGNGLIQKVKDKVFKE